ncbi:MAG: Hsp20/alpha crystallin family protein [Ignavibacteriales bacterium]|nr:Hsp20/alpha crystallin family protein [Ignavibacteriales bacterium]
MTLIKFKPFRELETLHDRILGIHPFGKRYFDDFPNFGFNLNDNFYPRIDISEDKDNINVLAEIPGVTKENIKITLQDNVLTIEGEKKKETEQKEKNYFRSERMYGSFKRCFTLPDLVDSEKVEAKFEDGMLNIQLKKIEQKVKSEKVIELK